MAWCWLRYQPDSARTRRFNQTTQGTEPKLPRTANRDRCGRPPGRDSAVALSKPGCRARATTRRIVAMGTNVDRWPARRQAIVGGRTAAGPVLYGVRDDDTEQTQSFLWVRLQQTVKRRPRRRCGEIIHTPVRTWLAAITAVAVVVPSGKAGKTCPQRDAAPPWVALPRNESS